MAALTMDAEDLMEPHDGRELYDFVAGHSERRDFSAAILCCNRIAQSDNKAIITDAMNLVADTRGNMMLHRLAAAVPFDEVNDKTQKPLLKELLQFFLKRRAPVAARNCRGQTALHVAAAAGNDVACEILLKFKSDIVAKDARLKLPEQLAEHNNHKALADSLKQQRHVLGMDAAGDDGYGGAAGGEGTTAVKEAESELERIIGIKTAELQKTVADARVMEDRAKAETRKEKKRREELEAEVTQLKTQKQALAVEHDKLTQQATESDKKVLRQEELVKSYKARLEMIMGVPANPAGKHSKSDVKTFLAQQDAKEAELQALRAQAKDTAELSRREEELREELSRMKSQSFVAAAVTGNSPPNPNAAGSGAQDASLDWTITTPTIHKKNSPQREAALPQEAAAKLAALEEELQAAKKRAEDLQASQAAAVAAADEAASANAAKLQSAEDEAERLRRQLQDLKAQKKNLEARLSDVEGGTTASQAKEASELSATLAALQQELHAAKAEATAKLAAVEEELAAAKKIAGELQSSHAAAAAASEAAASANATNLQQAMDDAGKLRRQLQDADAAKKAQEVRLSTSEADTNQLTKQLAGAEQEKASAVAQLAVCVADLSTQLDETRRQFGLQTATLQASMSEATSAAADARALRDKLDAVNQELTSAQRKLQAGASVDLATLTQLNELRIEQAICKAKLEGLQREMERTDLRMARAERDKDAADERVARADKALDEAKGKLQTVDRERSDVAMRLASTEQQVVGLQKEMARLDASSGAALILSEQVTNARRHSDELERVRARLQSELSSTETVLKASQDEKRELMRKLRAADDVLSTERQTSAGLRKELAAIQTALAEHRSATHELAVEKAVLEGDRERLLVHITSPRRGRSGNGNGGGSGGGDVLTATPEELVQQCAETQSQLLQARADVEYLQRSLKNSIEAIHNKEVTIVALEQQLLQLPTDVNAVQSQLLGTQRERDEAAVALRTVAQERDTAIAAASEAKRRYGDGPACAELDAQLAAHVAELLHLRALLQTATADAAALTQADAKAQRDVKGLKDAAFKLREQTILACTERDAAVGRCEAMQRQLTVVLQQVLDRDMALETAREVQAALRKDIVTLEKAFGEAITTTTAAGAATAPAKRSNIGVAAALQPLQLQLLQAQEAAERATAGGAETSDRMALHHFVAEAILRALIATERGKHQQHTAAAAAAPLPADAQQQVRAVGKSQIGRTVLELRQHHADDLLDHELGIVEDTSPGEEPDPVISPMPPADGGKGFARAGSAHVSHAAASRSRSAESDAPIIIDVPSNANFDFMKINGLVFSTTELPSVFYKQQCLLHQVRPCDHVLKQLQGCHAAADRHISIKTIDVSSCSLTRGAARAVIDLLFLCTGLEKLDLSRNFLADNASEYLRLVTVATQSQHGKRAVALTHLILDGNLLATTNALADLCDLVPTLTTISVGSSALLSQSSQAALHAKLEAKKNNSGGAVGGLGSPASLDPLLPIRPMVRSRPSSATRTPYTLRPVL